MTRVSTSALLRYRDDGPVETEAPEPEAPLPPATEIVAVRVSLRERVRAVAPPLQNLRSRIPPLRLDATTAPWIAGTVMLIGISALVIHDVRGTGRVAPTPVVVSPTSVAPRAAPRGDDDVPPISVAPSIAPEAIVIPESKPLPMVDLPPAPRVATVLHESRLQDKTPPAPVTSPEKAAAPKAVAITPKSPAVFGSQTVIYAPPAASAPVVTESAVDETPRLDYQLASIAGPDLALIASQEGGETVVMPYRKGDRLPDGSIISAIDVAQHLVVTSAGTLGPK